jgi:predicted MFS family arabinose efflux permease
MRLIPDPAAPGRLLVPTLVLVMTLTGVVSSLGAPLVPVVALRYGVPLASAQWTLTAPVLMGAVCTPLVGRLTTSPHRRRVLVVGVVVVALGLALAALPLGFAVLLLGRALQGAGLALAPLAIAIARDTVRPDRVVPVITILSVSAVAGAGLGFPLSALVAEYAGIAAAYALGLLVTLVALALTVVATPDSGHVRAAPLRLGDVGLVAGGSLLVLLALSECSAWHGDARLVGCLGAGAAALACWIRRSVGAQDPLVDLRTATRVDAAAAHLGALTAGAGTYLLLGLVMVLAEHPATAGYGLHLSVAAAGLLLVPYSLASVVGSRATLRLRRHLPPELLLPVGSVLFAVATTFLALWHATAWQAFVGMLIAGLGSSGTFAALPRLVVASVPPRDTGGAMAFNQLLRYLGFSTGSALVPVLLTSFGARRDPFTPAALCGSAIFLAGAAATGVLARCGRRPAVPTMTRPSVPTTQQERQAWTR